jgi:hypothetical protein
MDDVVVVGYGRMKKVRPELGCKHHFELPTWKRPSMSRWMMPCREKRPNVYVSQTSGEPGGGCFGDYQGYQYRHR